MTDKEHQELVELLGKPYADAARKAVHTGDLTEFLKAREEVGADRNEK